MMKIISVLLLLLPTAVFGQLSVGERIDNLQASEPNIVSQSALSQASSYQSRAKEAAIANLPANASALAVRKYYTLACLYFSTNGVSNPRTIEQLGDIVLPNWTSEVNWLATSEPCGDNLVGAWFGVTCNDAGQVTIIDLHSNQLYGTFPPEIVFFKGTLQVLELFNNFYLHTLGDAGNRWIGEMAALVNFYVGTTSFEYDGVPEYFSGATNLREIDISGTYMTEGPIRPEAFAGLDFLQYLDLSDNIYFTNTGSSIITAVDLPEMPSLTNFYMERCDFRPNNIDLTFLTKMPVLFEAWLDFTKFDGGIPAELGNTAPMLRSLSLSFCGLEGTIPDNLGDTNLDRLWLYGNELTGTIPTSFGQLVDMKFLFLESNMLGTGNPNSPHILPVEICAIGTMEELGIDCDIESNPGYVQCKCCTCCAGGCGNIPDPTPAPTQFPTFAPVAGGNTVQCPEGTFFIAGIGCLCFSGDSMVDVEDVGMVEMRNLKIGDSVKVDAGKYEPVFSFGHYLPERMGSFKEISTLSGNTITVSEDHMIEFSGGVFGPANMIKTGSNVMENGVATSVVSVKDVQSQGLYAPFTPSGKIVVDGISASCYVAFDKESTTMSIFGYEVSFQWLAHSFEFPHRLFCHYLGKCANEQYSQDGVSTWVEAPLRISKFVLSVDSDLIKSALFATAVAVLSVFRLVEMAAFQYPILLLIGLATFAANRRIKNKM